jgi:hypothetical protein
LIVNPKIKTSTMQIFLICLNSSNYSRHKCTFYLSNA